MERIAKTFEILPKRWIVERTFGWLNRYRRLSKDYELHSESSEAMIYSSLIRLMTRRLAASSFLFYEEELKNNNCNPSIVV